MLKVFTLFLFVAVIQSKTLDEENNSHHKNEPSKDILPLALTNSLQKENDKFNKSQLDTLISDLEAWQQEMIEMVNTEIKSLENLGDSNLKIDKELIKKLIDNTLKLLNALVRVGRAILAIVKDLMPI
ncbi:hypothetical protein RR48_07617 [Papilio machaon]|uniref:Uncharacterized protein n=1 Tax=Papilio machaon TaxID=76193 RepID=A0A194QUH0_PAPMA|nr:hypothetical protein RR48_07617 [Papilio machaon]